MKIWLSLVVFVWTTLFWSTTSLVQANELNPSFQNIIDNTWIKDFSLIKKDVSQIKKIAILAAHTKLLDENNQATLYDGGAWHRNYPYRTVTSYEVDHYYPDQVYAEYLYSRQLSQQLKKYLMQSGFEVAIIDPAVPDRNLYIRRSVTESLLWGADLLVTLHTDGNYDQNARGCFAIVDDRFVRSKTNNQAILDALNNLNTDIGIPIATHYGDNGIYSTTQVGLNRLAYGVRTNTSILFDENLHFFIQDRLVPPDVIYLEVGTHSNKEDLDLLLNKQKQIATAIGSAITQNYKVGLVENPNRVLLGKYVGKGEYLSWR